MPVPTCDNAISLIFPMSNPLMEVQLVLKSISSQDDVPQTIPPQVSLTPNLSPQDEAVASWSKPVSPEVIRRLTRLRPGISLAHVLLEWVLISGAIVGSWWLWKWNLVAGIAGYVLAVIWIGARQHALAILMHEGAHYRLHSNRTLNEFIAQLLVSWPMLIDVRFYRRSHFAHHRSPNTSDDPDWKIREGEDWTFPKTRLGLLRVFLLDLSGLNLLDQWREFGRYGVEVKWKQSAWDIGRIIYFLTFPIVLTVFHWWPMFLMYWIVPMLTSLKAVLRMRTIAEHYGLKYDHIYRETRTTYPTLLDKLIIAPKNIGYHLDHHLYPSIPFYNLPQLHKELLLLEEFRNEAHLTHGYRTVLQECLACSRTVTSAERADKTSTAV